MGIGKRVMQIEKLKKMSQAEQLDFFFEQVNWDSDNHKYKNEILALVLHPDGSYSATESYDGGGFSDEYRHYDIGAFGAATLDEFLFKAQEYYLHYQFKQPPLVVVPAPPKA